MSGASPRPPVTVDDLIARAEITDVIMDLARGTDRLDEDLMAGCYHPDGFDDHNAFRGSGTEFAKWVVDVLPHFEATMHFVGPPRIRLDPADPDVAHVDTYCEAHHVSRPDADGHQTDMVLGLRYVDRFERRPSGRGGHWLVAKRVCAFDWSSTVTTDAAARYRFEPDFTVGRRFGDRDRTDITYLNPNPSPNPSTNPMAPGEDQQ
jgi:hypothetical protein